MANVASPWLYCLHKGRRIACTLLCSWLAAGGTTRNVTLTVLNSALQGGLAGEGTTAASLTRNSSSNLGRPAGSGEMLSRDAVIEKAKQVLTSLSFTTHRVSIAWGLKRV